MAPNGFLRQRRKQRRSKQRKKAAPFMVEEADYDRSGCRSNIGVGIIAGHRILFYLSFKKTKTGT
jgi:hypothetical protein